TNWPPRHLKPMYLLGRVALRYDEPTAVGQRRTYDALVVEAAASPGVLPWQRALDSYKTWLTSKLKSSELVPTPSPSLRAANGWLNVELQNMGSWDASYTRSIWQRFRNQLPRVQFWGQMSDYYKPFSQERVGCCLDVPEIHRRYLPDI